MERVFGHSRIPATGAPAPACTVTVYNTGTAVLATLYSDDLAAPTPKANPFAADATGFWFFYAAAGRYDAVFSGGGIPAGSEYTLADVPAGLGDGPIVPFTYATLPATSAPHAGRIARVTDQQKGLWIDDGAAWAPALDFGFRSFAKANLPAAGVAGRIRRVTDDRQGLYVDDGAAWFPALAYALEAHTKAALPAAALAGRLRRVTNGPRGVWMDTGTAWFGLGGEVANVVEFGAVRDGATDDLAAIQAAIDALATTGGTVIFPPGTYGVSGPILVRTGVRLQGMAPASKVVIQAIAGWAGDCFIRAYRRDDNVLANIDEIGASGLAFLMSAAAPDGFAAIDLVGVCNSLVSDCTVTLSPSAALNDAILRMADNNVAVTSAKVCRSNLVLRLNGVASCFLVATQAVAGRSDNNVVIGFEATGLIYGLDFHLVTTGVLRLVLVGGRLVSTGEAGAAPIAVGAQPLPANLAVLQVSFTSFPAGSRLPEELFFSRVPGFSASGTTIVTPLSSGGTLAQDFNGSVYLRVVSGTVLTPGVNTFLYTLTGVAQAEAFVVAPVLGIPATPVTFQGSNVLTLFTLTIVAGSQVTLASDLVLRVLRLGS